MKKEQSQSLIPFLELGDSPLRENWPTPNASDAHDPNMKNEHDVKKSYLRGVVLEQLPLPKSTLMQVQCLPTDIPAFQTSAAFATLPAIHFLAEQVTAQLTLLLEVSRVNHTPPPDLEKLTRMRETFGKSVLECFGKYDQSSDCLKMSGAYLRVQKEIFSTELCQTWPKSGMGFCGMLYQLVPLAHLTKENGYGSLSSMNWPTVRASEYKDTGPQGSKSQQHMLNRSYLCAVVSEEESKHSGPVDQDNPNLTGNHHERSWGTPRAVDAGNWMMNKARLAAGKPEDTLCDQVLQTPTKSDNKSPGISRDVHLNHQTGGKLNPTWVECLMGYPQGWTQLPYKWKAERKIKTQPKTVPTD